LDLAESFLGVALTVDPHSFSQNLRHMRICVVLGPGGVGKTTTSIAIAMVAARMGLNVGLLSIDPAKRLSAALGLSIGSEQKPIRFPKEFSVEGQLDAAMLDQKAVFDQMVMRQSKSPEAAAKILDHPLYQAASTKLAGPLEYMALAKLQEMSDTGKYDLVVLDTPPDTHALDFLKRPNILSGFMEHKVMTWLVKPFHLASRLGVGKLLSVSERLMGGVAKVTGFTALSLFAEFLVLMQQVIEGFHHSGEEIIRLLKRKDTTFLIVSAPSAASVRSSLNLATQIKELEYRLGGVIINRCLPKTLRDKLLKNPDLKQIDRDLRLLLDLVMSRWQGEATAIDSLTKGLEKIHRPPCQMLLLDEQSQDLHSADGIFHFSTLLDAALWQDRPSSNS
jgi:anion-transporting  ArsA/GET3 family ATPase